jgi:hypothetical protein
VTSEFTPLAESEVEYANAARAKRRREGTAAPEPEASPIRDATLRARWRDLLRHIFLVDPLQCRRCGGRLYLVEVVTNPYRVEALLRFLGLWHGRSPPAPPRPGGPPPVPQPEIQHDPECAPQHADDDESQVPPDWDQD